MTALTIAQHHESKRHETRRRRAVLAVAYTLLALSCDNPLGPDEEGVGRVEVQPQVVNVVAGASSGLSAAVYDISGKPLSARRIFWSVANSSIATVSQTGTVTGVTQGTTQVSASAGGKSGVATVTVTGRPVAVVRVNPSAHQVTVGGTVQLTATPQDANGATVPGRPVTWATSSASVASVSSTGLVTALSAGTANVTATVDGVSGASVVTVTPVPVANVRLVPTSARLTVGEEMQFTATPVDANGNALSGRTITWASSSARVATVSSTGRVLARETGIADISATVEGKSASAPVLVVPVAVDTVSVSPSSVTIQSGQTAQLSVRLVDDKGNVLSGRSVTWTSDQPSIATVSQAGLVTGVGQGTARITAESEGKTGSATVNVTPVAIATLSVAPASVSIAIGATAQLTATAKDAQGNALPGRQITWLTGSPSVATVSQSGRVTGVGAGSALVFAAAEGVSGSATVNVATIPVSQVRVAPASSNVVQGGSVQLSAQTLDAQGNLLAGRVVTWTSSNPSVAVVSGSGLVTTIAPGTVTITATSEGVNGTASVSVSAVPVASVTISPSQTTLVPGNSTTLSVTLRDASGNVLSGRAVSWTSSNTSVATVNQSGLVTAVAQGSSTITATSEGVQGTATVTVSAVPVASVTVTPGSASLSIGQTQQLTATTRDASNNVLTGRVVTWSSANPSVATVSGSGLVTAVAPGSSAITATSEGIVSNPPVVVTVTNVPIAEITVSPGAVSIAEGANTTLTATARDASGNVLTGRTFTWSSNTPSISVSQSGVVTTEIGDASGTPAVITASAEGKSGSANVTVTYLPVTSVTVIPSPMTVQVGATAPLAATLLNGSTTLPSSGRTITWGPSQNPSIASVNASGAVTGIAQGSTSIPVSASSPGQGTPASTSVSVTVNNVPVASVTVTPGPTETMFVGSQYQRTFTFTARDAQGNVLTGRSGVWTSSNQSAATIDAATGVAVGAGVGSTEIRATVEGVQGLSNVTVSLVPVARTDVTPTSGNLAPGQQLQLTATAKDATNATISSGALAGRTPTFTSNATSVATVSSPQGMVTAVADGQATISATVDGVGGGTTSLITVTTPITSVTLTPSNTTVLQGGQVGLTLDAKSASGTGLAGRSCTLTSGDVTKATVSPANGTTNASGQISATVTGVAASATPVTITGTCSGVNGTSTVTVLLPINAVTVTPTPTNVVIGTPGTLTVDVKNNTTSLAGRSCTLSSSDVAKATVSPSSATTDANGQIALTVTGVAATTGTPVSISATCEGVQGASSVTVLAAINSVTVTPSAATVSIGASTPLTIDVKDSGGSGLSGRACTIASNDAAKVSVSPTSGTTNGSGQISVTATANAAGSAIITATCEGKSGTSTITVPAPVSSVTLTPATANVGIGATTPITLTARDAGGSVLSGRACTISSGDASKATVSPASGTTNASGDIALTITGVAATSGTPVTITGTCEGVNGTAAVTVLTPINSVSFTPSSATVAAGGTVPLTLNARDSGNNGLAGRACTIASSDVSKATVSPANGTTNASGQVAVTVTGVAAGSATITGTCEGVNGNSAITVNAPVNSVTLTPSAGNVVVGSTLPITVQVRDAANNALSGRACTISSSDAAKATVSPTSGNTDGSGQIALTVTGVAATTGTPVTITTTCESVNGTSNVTVLTPISSVSLSPSSATLLPGGTAPITLTARDAGSVALAGRACTMSSSDATKATVSPSSGTTDASGQIALTVTAVAAGSATITGTCEGSNGTSSITVNAPVNTVTVTPSTANVVEGAQLSLTAEARDASNNVLAGRACTMASGDPAKATVSPTSGTTNASGQTTFNVTGVAAGSATITVTCETKQGTSAITVLAAINSVTVTPASETVNVGASKPLTVDVKDAGNVALPGRACTIASSNTSIATVTPNPNGTTDANGQIALTVNGVATGSATITVTCEGKPGTSAITVP